jgi:hypothetical protein
MNRQFELNQELNFDYPVVSIGSHPDNDIVLAGGNVLAFHATVHLQDGVYQLVALGGDSTVLVDGAPLSASPTQISPYQRVEIGNYALFFQQNGAVDSVHVSVSQLNAQPGADSAARTMTVAPGETPILVNVPVKTQEVDVDQTAVYELEVINAGPIVAAFRVMLEGVPPEWVEISPALVNLNEGQRTFVSVRVSPPRDTTSEAGKHTLQVRVQSSNYGGHTVSTPLTLVIHPFYEFGIGNLSPKDQTIAWRKRVGKTELSVANRGNSPADFSISVMDDENGCTFDLAVDDETQLTRQAVVNIPPGEKISLPIWITPHKRPFFALLPKRYQYSVTVQAPDAVAPQMTSGSVSAAPLLGWWHVFLMVVLLGVGLFLLFQPNIYSFQLAAGKDVIELGDTTRLEWSVSPFATNLSISGVEQAINPGQTSLTLAPTQSTTYEIVAGNWLSSLLRIDQRRALTVLVVPPSPRVTVFDVDETSVAKGKPINVRWSVTRADKVFLTIDEVVYELSREEFSGERAVVLEKDALVILEAQNASGSEVRSYYVNVVEPKITVRTFTVWVRPQSGASAPASSGAMFRMLNAPDPNFPERYVELVPDRSSDSGYRVEFYSPERELAKGEQVMIEWDIAGTDNEKIQIAPFTDALPARGSQPFFPQESMNFVLTAKSGELEQLFMLPVKVFDGQPPQAPKIEFFRASPLKATGPTNVQFAWSVSGNWTRVQLATEGQVVADFLNPQAFRTLTVSKSSTYILTAFNGTLSSAAPVEITIDPALKDVGLYFKQAFPATGRFLINDSVSFTLDFYDIEKSKPESGVYVEPAVAPTGTILVTDGVSLCTIALPAKTCDLKFTTPGDPKEITASYSGDTVYASASTDKPYGQYISVISSTVTLTPTYYLLNRTTPADSVNTSPINLTSAPRSMDTGLFIRVGITPQGSSLPTPDAGKVNLYLCRQRAKAGGGFELVTGSCEPRGFASITLNPVPGATPAGFADIILNSFPSAGTYALLFSYSGEGFEPGERVEYNVVISKVGIKLGFAGCNLGPGANCELGTSTPASTKVIFEVLKSDGTRLPADLTSPVINAYEISELIGGSYAPWSCQMAIQTTLGSNFWVIECTVNFATSAPPGSSLRSPSSMAFQFDAADDPNYTASPVSYNFIITAKQNTFVSLTAAALAGLKVGQLVEFTTANGLDGIVQLVDAANTKLIPTGAITITASENNVFPLNADYPSSTAGCTVDAAGKVLTIASIDTACSIYFRKVVAGLQLTVSYAGNASNFMSTSQDPVTVSVAKQTDITLNWQYEDTPSNYVTWGGKNSILPNSNFRIRISLSGPSNFSTTALRNGGAMIITINEPSCLVTGTSIGGGNPTYTVPITNTGVGQTPRIDFTLTCTQAPRTVTINAQLSNTTDFAIQSGQPQSQLLGVLDRSGRYIEVSFIRHAPLEQDRVAIFTTSGGVSSMAPLHFGARYDVRLTVGRIYADTGTGSRLDVINTYLAANHRAQIRLDAAIFATIDWGRSTCINLDSTNANTVGVPLDAYRVVYDFGNPNLTQPGLTDIEMYNNTPCRLYFDQATNTPITNGTAQYHFNVSGFTHTLPPSSTLATQLVKQTVTMTTSPSPYTYDVYVDSPLSNFNLNVTPQNAGTELNPLVSPIGTQLTFSSTCGLTTGASFTSRILAQISLTPSLTTCDTSANLTITYAGNNWFQSNSFVQPVLVRKHNPDMNLLLKQPNSTYATFTPPANIKVNDVLEFQVQLRRGTGFASTPLPSGKVRIWMVDTDNTTKLGTSIYELTGAGVTYDATNLWYEVNLNASGDAFFNLTVKGAKANIRLVYHYVGTLPGGNPGDSYYYGKQQQTDYLEFKP